MMWRGFSFSDFSNFKIFSDLRISKFLAICLLGKIANWGQCWRWSSLHAAHGKKEKPFIVEIVMH